MRARAAKGSLKALCGESPRRRRTYIERMRKMKILVRYRNQKSITCKVNRFNTMYQ